MARVLLVGCGARGRALAEQLIGEGHAVRATSRDPGRRAAAHACGAEAIAADPDRVSTLWPAFAGTAIVCHLLGSATGTPEALSALHSTRLEMLLTKLIDSPVRGFLYESAGTVPSEILEAGARTVQQHCELSRIPYAITGAPVACERESLERTAALIGGLLAR